MYVHVEKFRRFYGCFTQIVNKDMSYKLNPVIIRGDSVSCLKPKQLDKQVEDMHLKRICRQIETGHVHLGVELEVPLSRIDQILTEHPGSVRRQCYEIMIEWKQREAGQTTFRNLEQAFKCFGIDPDILKRSVN